MNRGLSQSGWSSLVTQSNVGPVGQYSANGTQPYGGLTVTMDGANLVDPGNMGTQVANINKDQTAEVTLLNSAFGAEYAKGPVTFEAIGRAAPPTTTVRYTSMAASRLWIRRNRSPGASAAGKKLTVPYTRAARSAARCSFPAPASTANAISFSST